MAYALAGVRQHQKTVMSGAPGFNGNIEATLVIVNKKTLSFSADLKFYTGDAGTPHKLITPSDDGGKVKVFSSVDNLVTWINGAFSGVTNVKFDIPDIEDVAKPFTPPTDPVADAVKKKASIEKLKASTQLRLTDATHDVTVAAGLGWNAPTAHPALQAKYAELVLNKNTVQSYVTYYTARIAALDAIITP